MATLSELQTARADAGTAYATALADLNGVYIALAALDRTLSNRNVHNIAVPGFARDHALTDDVISRFLTHPEFAPNLAHDWESQIFSTSNSQVAAFSTS
mgnify:CR=1 FL=1